MTARLATMWHWLVLAARMLVGVPPYESYVAHMQAHHPGEKILTRVEFFRDRQNARFGVGGKGGFRCC